MRSRDTGNAAQVGTSPENLRMPVVQAGDIAGAFRDSAPRQFPSPSPRTSSRISSGHHPTISHFPCHKVKPRPHNAVGPLLCTWAGADNVTSPVHMGETTPRIADRT